MKGSARSRSTAAGSKVDGREGTTRSLTSSLSLRGAAGDAADVSLSPSRPSASALLPAGLCAPSFIFLAARIGPCPKQKEKVQYCCHHALVVSVIKALGSDFG